MHVRRWGAALAVALALGSLAVPTATAAPVTAGSSIPTPGPARTTTTDGIAVTNDAYGSTLTWRPDERLPMGDARPEFHARGASLGVPTQVSGQLRLRISGATTLRSSEVSVVSAGRVLAGAGQGASVRAAKAPVVAPVSRVVAKDPGVAGRYRTTSFTYALPSFSYPGYRSKIEMRGHVVAPVGAKGHRGIVLFLHGRHATCYSSDGELSIDWPCSGGMSAIPSYLGYTYQQKLLASQGFVTVSIAANGINGQDGDDIDSGAAARGVLVRKHLDLLADWEAGKGAGPEQRRKLAGHLNLRKVMTVGHSRGGEGVNRAAIKASAGDRFRIAGQVLIAPTDFGQQVAVGVPTTVVLPYCDGDVSDLQGQMFVDQGARMASGDRAIKTAVLVLGANHNFFNSQWTPKIAKAPANDDWYDSDAVCGATAPTRLTAKQQRAVGATYVAAAARTYLTADTSALELLDGTPVRARSAGKAIALTHAVGGRRVPLVLPGSAPTFRTSGKAKAEVCVGFPSDMLGSSASSEAPAPFDDVCDASGATSPHWSPIAWGAGAESPRAVKVSWTAKKSRVTFTPARALASARYLDLRVIVPEQKTTPTFDVVIKDTAGHAFVVEPQRTATLLPPTPMGHGWAQNVRAKLPAGLDRTKVASIALRSTSARGKVILLDMYGSARGQVPSTATVRTVARLDVPSSTVFTSTTDGESVSTLRIPVGNAFTLTARVDLAIMDATNGFTTVRHVTVRPGQKFVDVPVRYSGDDAYSAESSIVPGYAVVAVARRNAVVDSYVGSLSTRSHSPRPTLTVDQTTSSAAPGQSLQWVVRLSGPVTQDTWLPITAVAPGGSELAGRDLLPGWAALNLVGPATTDPISTSGLRVSPTIPAFATSVVVELPIRRGVSFTGVRTVALDLDLSEYGGGIVRLTGTVTAP